MTTQEEVQRRLLDSIAGRRATRLTLLMTTLSELNRVSEEQRTVPADERRTELLKVLNVETNHLETENERLEISRARRTERRATRSRNREEKSLPEANDEYSPACVL